MNQPCRRPSATTLDRFRTLYLGGATYAQISRLMGCGTAAAFARWRAILDLPRRVAARPRANRKSPCRKPSGCPPIGRTQLRHCEHCDQITRGTKPCQWCKTPWPGDAS